MKIQGGQKGREARRVATSGNRCIWMRAGVVDFQACDHGFDCTSCDFDKGISRELAQKPAAPVSWREVMNQPQLHKECRHMLTGRVIFKLCAHNYQCKDCAYDQFLYEYDRQAVEEKLPVPAAPQAEEARGLMAAYA